MRRCARGLAFGVAAAASFSGVSCSLLVNVDPLVDGSDTGPDGDSVDAMRTDAPSGLDSGVADGAMGDAAQDAAWCATQPAHTRCFDFDTVATAGVGWDGNNISPGGAVALDTTTYESPPASMSSSVTDGTVQGGTFAVLIENIPASASTVTLAFDVQTDLGAGSTYPADANLVELYYGSNWVSVGVSSQGPSLDWNLPTSSSYESGQYALSPLASDASGWTRIQMTVTFGEPWLLSVSFDGKMEFQQDMAGSVTSSSPQVSVGLGVAAFGGTTPLTAHYDNVTFDVQ